MKRLINTDKACIEKKGKFISFICTIIVIIIVSSIIIMVTGKGLSTFIKDNVSLSDFLLSTDWNPGKVGPLNKPLVGALPMIIGSFSVTFISTFTAIPFALGLAIYMVELSSNIGRTFLKPVIEILVGIPSVVYGLIGLSTVIPFIRRFSGGSGFGILAGSIVLTVIILPTITSLCTDAISSVDSGVKEAALALGCTKWQMIYKVVLKSAIPGIMTAVVLGMSRAFGEALAVQMVIGNTTIIPKSLVTPASTLTSVLTTNMGNTIPGQIQNNVLWTLALLLMIMSLFFILIIHLIGRKRKDE